MTMEERNHREDLSALMDGELGTEPAHFLLRRMQGDPELARAWSRWHLIRACLAERAQSSTHSDPIRIAAASDDDAFVARVMAQVQTTAQPRRHWARYVGGGAIAASVAAAALMLSVPQSTSTDGVAAGGAERHFARAPAATLSAAPLASRIAATPVDRTSPLPWLDRQSTFLAAHPAAGSTMLSGNYLQQAAYAPDGGARMLMREPQQQTSGAPYMILLVPDQNARRAQPQVPQQH
jgi:sigma-E factor negative regulatory protein RseA